MANQTSSSNRIGDPLGAAATLGEAFIAPGKVTLNERMNRAAPLLWPSPGEIIRAWYTGRLSDDLVKESLGSQGINIGQCGDNAFGALVKPWVGAATAVSRSKCWQAVADSQRMYPAFAQLYRARMAGLMTEADMQRMMRLAHVPDRESWDVCKVYLQDWPGQAELDTLFLRDVITQQQWESQTRLIRACDDPTLGRFDELRYRYPGVGTAQLYAARSTLTGGLSDVWGLFDGMPPAVEAYYRREGLGRPTEEMAVVDGQPSKLTYALMDWAAHWQLPGVGEIGDMYHRLRPDRLARYVGLGISPDPVTLDDAKQLLTLAGIPPSMQDQQIAMSYRQLPLRMARIYWVTEQWTDKQVVDYLQDQGLTPSDSSDLVDAWDLQLYQQEQAKEQALQERAESKYILQVLAMYRQGSMTQADATTAMMQADWQPERAAVAISTADLQVQEQSIQQRLLYLRREYLRGGYSQYEVEIQLGQLGISTDRAAQYAADWQWELSHTRLSISTGQVLRLYREGILDRQSAYSRLSNLGWANPDEQLLFAEVDQQIATSQAKQYDAALKSRVKQAAAYQKLQQAAVKQFASAQKKLRQQIGVGKTLSLLKDGVVDAEWAEQHLISIGETPQSVQLLMAQANVQMSKADLAALQKAAKQAQGIAHLIPLKDLQTAVGQGTISVSDFQGALAQQGLTSAEIEIETALYAPRNTASPIAGVLAPTAAPIAGPTPPAGAVSPGAAQVDSTVSGLAPAAAAGNPGTPVVPQTNTAGGDSADTQPAGGAVAPTGAQSPSATSPPLPLGPDAPGQGAMVASPLPAPPALTSPAQPAPEQQTPPADTQPPAQSTEGP